jgi:peptidoglycan-associated lipoprotein
MRIFTAALALSFAAFSGCVHAPTPLSTETAMSQPPPVAPTPKLQAEPAAAPTVDANAELEAALKGVSVYFDFDNDRLKPESMDALQKVSVVLRKHHGAMLKIEGNCDERGTEEYNLMLGQRRAEAARKYLSALGVSDTQLDTISYGSLRPANPGHSEDAWSENRRDELRASR